MYNLFLKVENCKSYYKEQQRYVQSADLFAEYVTLQFKETDTIKSVSGNNLGVSDE